MTVSGIVPSAETSDHPASTEVAARRRLSVSDLKAAVLAAHDSPDAGPAPVRGSAVQSGAERGGAGGDAGRSVVTPTRPSPADADPEQWLPDHDEPVSLADLPAPRRRAGTRAPESDLPVRRSGPPSRPYRAAPRDRRLADGIRTAGNVRIALLGAAGGAGTTTAATLVALALTCAHSSVVSLATSEADNGALGVRWGVDGLDLAEIAQHVRSPRATLGPAAPGVATRSIDSAEVVVAGEVRSPGEHHWRPQDVGPMLAAAERSAVPVVIDAGRPTELTTREVLASATHILLVAPRTVAGLLAAEFSIEDLAARFEIAPGALGLLVNDTYGRTPGRRARAAMTRLDALDLPRFDLPFDRSLREGPALEWTSLASSTRTGALTVLTHLLLGKA